MSREDVRAGGARGGDHVPGDRLGADRHLQPWQGRNPIGTWVLMEVVAPGASAVHGEVHGEQRRESRASAYRAKRERTGGSLA
jgi:hypothetical protein